MSSSKKNSKSSSNPKWKSKATSHQNLTDVVVESSGIFSFSPSQSKFAIINPNSASGILRIYSTQITDDSNSNPSSMKCGNLISSYLIPSGTKPTSLNWFSLPSPSQPVPNNKRRKSQSQSESDGKHSSSIGSQELILLSLSTSSILVYDPQSSTVRFVLKDSSTSSSSSSTTNHVNSNSTHIFATSNGIVRVWNISSLLGGGENKNHQKPIEPNFTFIPDSNTKVISSSPYPNSNIDNVDSNIPILSAHHSILLHSIGHDGSSSSSSEQPLVKFTGHATDVSHLLWLPSKLDHSNDGGKSNLRFLSASKGDRILTIWSTEVDLSSSSKKKKPINGNAKYTISLDSDVKDIHVDFQNGDEGGESLLNIVTRSGQSLLYLIPSISSSSSSSDSNSTSAPQALKPTTVLTILPSQKAKAEEALPITAAAILQGGKKDVKVKIVRSPKGLEGDAGIVADEVSILSNNSSSYPPTISIVRSPLTSSLQPTSSTSSGLPSTQRYTDPSSISGNTSGSAGVGTGEVELGALLGGIPKTNGDSGLEDVEIDMDEPTLAHRLGEMKVKKSSSGNQDSSSDSSDEEMEDNDKMAPQSSATLTSTLLQALHTSDSSLLSSILTKGSPQLIRPTILRLPSSAALPLLEACLQRLARGGNQSRSRGSLGTREAKAIVTWIRETLLIHMASLMSIPGLIPRLANLYGTLNKRLENREKLQALEGRLGLVVGQIQVRKGYEEFNRKNKSKRNRNRDDGEEKVWREESDDEDDEEDEDEDEDEDEMDIDIENQAKGRSNGFGDVEAADDFGEIEEIDMSYAGGKKSKSKKSQGEESDEEEDDDDEDDDDEEDSENEVIQRRRKVGKKSKGDQMDLDDQSGDDDEEEEEEEGQTDDDSDDDEIDEEDESLLDEDEDDIEDSEEDSDDGEGNKGGPKGMFDMEAEESDGEEESEAEESE